MADKILWIPALVFLLGLLVFFHELGHFIVAKLLRIRVEEFAFGFGPKWIRLFKRGDTEYTIHPVPLGGFVKLAGESSGGPIVEGGFNSKPWYQRWLVYSAGPVFSFLLAYIIFCAMGVTVGLPEGGTYNLVNYIQPGSRAEKADLRVGDRIVRIDEKPIRTGEEMVKTIHSSADVPLTIYIERDGQTVVVRATPEKKKLGKEEVGLLGFMAKPKLKRAGLVESAKTGTMMTYEYGRALVKLVFSKEIKENVGGPLAIANETRNAVKRGMADYLTLAAMLSLSLGVFNLLPIPIVDGGQMALLVVEGIKGKRLSQRTWEVAQLVGLATIALIFIAIMIMDVNRWIGGQLFK